MSFLRIFLGVIVFILTGEVLLFLYFGLGGREAGPYLTVMSADGIALIALLFLILHGLLIPLQNIRRTLERAEKGDFQTRAPSSFLKEMQELASTVNEVIEKEKQHRDEVQEAKAALEIKVEARTQELQEVAENLEQKVAARTKELEAKVRELERFQKLAVGRELKMIELKKEIEALGGERKAPAKSGEQS